MSCYKSYYRLLSLQLSNIQIATKTGWTINIRQKQSSMAQKSSAPVCCRRHNTYKHTHISICIWPNKMLAMIIQNSLIYVSVKIAYLICVLRLYVSECVLCWYMMNKMLAIIICKSRLDANGLLNRILFQKIHIARLTSGRKSIEK